MTAKHTESSESRCQFRFADGRRCRLPAVSGQALPAITKAGLPASTSSSGLCYPHANAPNRRLRPSDLIRELASPAGALVPDAKIHRLLAKLPIALADGTIPQDQFRAMNSICYVMLQCSRLSAANHA